MKRMNVAKLNTALESPKTRNTLGLLSAALCGVKSYSLNPVIWHDIKEEFKIQAVFPLVGTVDILPGLSDLDKR